MNKSIVFKLIAGGFVVSVFCAIALFAYYELRDVPEFADGFESGSVAAHWIFDKKGECNIDVVKDIARSGEHSIRFQAGENVRCEILPWPYKDNVVDYHLREPYERERWYAFSTYLVLPWEIDDKNEVIAQWHSSKDIFLGEKSGRGPPLALRIFGARWRITYGWDKQLLSSPGRKAYWGLWEQPIETGVWSDWVFRVRWSHKDDGLLEIWKDGKKIVSHQGPNTYNDIRGNYLKLGPYHPPAHRTVYLDDISLSNHAIDVNNSSPK